jgi:hypothetical protein
MLKKILIILVILAVVIVVSAAAWLSYMGFFAKVTVIERKMGPLTFVYMPFKGDYAKTVPVFEAVRNKLAKEFNVRNVEGMGIYYSDPKATKKEALRSDIGCLLERADALRADEIMKRMKVRIMFPKKYCTAEFPIKNQMSIILGIIKVYPEITKYMKTKGYRMTPAMEIYEKGKIIYAFEIKK